MERRWVAVMLTMPSFDRAAPKRMAIAGAGTAGLVGCCRMTRHQQAMAPQQPHNKLIAQAARAVLRPMGLRQKGRSRIWLDDHGWWLGVVEFQPSAWSKGSYLNVGACWLWHPGSKSAISFDLGHRVEGHVPFHNPAQFQPQARRLADRAAEEITRLRAMLPTIIAAASLLAKLADGNREVAGSSSGYQGWHHWNAAVALGLARRSQAAAAMFRRVARSDDDDDWWQPVKRQAEQLHELVQTDPAAFRAVIDGYISHNRAGLNLPPVAAEVAAERPDG
jgi:hypothetical protein